MLDYKFLHKVECLSDYINITEIVEFTIIMEILDVLPIPICMKGISINPGDVYMQLSRVHSSIETTTKT